MWQWRMMSYFISLWKINASIPASKKLQHITNTGRLLNMTNCCSNVHFIPHSRNTSTWIFHMEIHCDLSEVNNRRILSPGMRRHLTSSTVLETWLILVRHQHDKVVYFLTCVNLLWVLLNYNAESAFTFVKWRAVLVWLGCDWVPRYWHLKWAHFFSSWLQKNKE
jgi:hypothetical protein